MADLGTALVALTTAVITGGVALLSVHVTNKATAERNKLQLEHGAEQKKKEQLLEKAEELYQLTDQWLNGFSTHFLYLIPVMKGQSDYNSYLDAIIEYGKAQEKKFVRVEMLLHIHFSQLLEPYERVLKQRELFNDVIGKHKQAYKQGDLNGERFIEPLTKTALQLDATGEALKSAIADAAKRIAG